MENIAHTEATIGHISANVEAETEIEARLVEHMTERLARQLTERFSALEAKLEAALNTRLAALEVSAAASVPEQVTNGRKTLPVAMTSLLAKQGVTIDSMEAGSLDAALSTLSMEQRFAVKAQLLRSGLLS